MLGLAMSNGDCERLAYLIVSFHGWIRPQEFSKLLQDAVVIFLNSDLSYSDRETALGIFRIRAPNMQRQLDCQHVLIELKLVRDVLVVLRDAVYKKLPPTTRGKLKTTRQCREAFASSR